MALMSDASAVRRPRIHAAAQARLRGDRVGSIPYICILLQCHPGAAQPAVANMRRGGSRARGQAVNRVQEGGDTGTAPQGDRVLEC
jgi:hypothetical protein